MRRFGGIATGRAQFSLKTRNRTVQSIGLALYIGFPEGRLKTQQLPKKRLAGAFIDRTPYLRRGIRQASDGLGKQRVIFSHFAFRAFPGHSVNCRAALRRSHFVHRSRDPHCGPNQLCFKN